MSEKKNLKITIISSNWIYKKDKERKQFFGKPQYKFLDFLAKNFLVDITVIAPTFSTDNPKGFSLEKLKIEELPFFKGTLNQLKKFYLIPLIVTKYLYHIRKSDVVIIWNRDLFSTLGLILAKLLKKKVIYILGDIWYNNIYYKYGKIVAWFYKPLFFLQKFFLNLDKSNSLLLVNYNTHIIKEAEKLGVKYKKYLISLIPKKDFFRKEEVNLISKDPIRILYVGWLIKNKGVQDLIEAVSKLQSEFPHKTIELHIVGDGNYRRTLEELAQKLNIYVKFYGLISDWNKLLSLYRQADIFVLPSYGEGWPKVIFEAFSQSLVVVCSDVIDIEQCIKFKTGDVNHLKEILKEILTNEEIVNNFYKKLDALKDSYSIEEAATQFYKYIKEFVNN